MKTVRDVIEYFEYLCEQHPDLLHSTASGERIFEVVAYEDAFGDFRTAAAEKTFFVRLILPQMTFKNRSENALKVYELGLMVGQYFSTREATNSDRNDAWHDAERVADDFIQRIVADARNGHPLFSGTARDVESMDISAAFLPQVTDGSFCAVLYTFSFGTFRCIDPAGSGVADWADGGLTAF